MQCGLRHVDEWRHVSGVLDHVQTKTNSLEKQRFYATTRCFGHFHFSYSFHTFKVCLIAI